MAKNNLITTIIVAVLVGGLGFYGGTLYQKNKQGNLAGRMNRGFAPQQGGAARQGNALGARPVSGEITSTDNESITIKTQNSGNKLVIISDSTKINKMSEGTKSERNLNNPLPSQLQISEFRTPFTPPRCDKTKP